MRFAKDFGRGFQFFATGLKSWATQPKLLFLGAIPALITSALMFLLLWWAIPNTYDWSTALTGFADGWGLALRETMRITLALALAAAIIALCLLTFVNITLLIGSPFYEQIAKRIERARGGIDGEVQLGLGRQISKGIDDFLQMVRMTSSTASIAFLIGLIPVVGPALATIVVTTRGTRALALELTAFAGDTRGWTFAQRKAKLNKHLPMTFGSALPSYLAFLVPGLAVIVMPAAVVAGTLLVRELAD